MNAPTTEPEGEVLAGGLPLAPEHVTMRMFDQDYPLTHASAVVVQSAPEFGCVALAIGRPDFEHGFFMGMSPSMARSVAGWLCAQADAVDGGVGKQ